MNFDKLLINQDSEIKKILEFCELETSNDQFKNQVIFKKDLSLSIDFKTISIKDISSKLGPIIPQFISSIIAIVWYQLLSKR